MQRLGEQKERDIAEAKEQLTAQQVRYVWTVYHDGGYTPVQQPLDDCRRKTYRFPARSRTQIEFRWCRRRFQTSQFLVDCHKPKERRPLPFLNTSPVASPNVSCFDSSYSISDPIRLILVRAHSTFLTVASDHSRSAIAMSPVSCALSGDQRPLCSTSPSMHFPLTHSIHQMYGTTTNHTE